MHYLGTLFLGAFYKHGKSVLPQHYPTVLNWIIQVWKKEEAVVITFQYSNSSESS